MERGPIHPVRRRIADRRAAVRSLLARLTRADVAALFKLALAGNLVYYVLLACAVHLIGIAPTSLIIGVLPVTVPLVGRRDHGAVPLARLALPLALVIGRHRQHQRRRPQRHDIHVERLAGDACRACVRRRRVGLLDLVRARERPL